MPDTTKKVNGTGENGASETEADLLFIVNNCCTANPELHPSQYYFELLEDTERSMTMPNNSDIMRINLR